MCMYILIFNLTWGLPPGLSCCRSTPRPPQDPPAFLWGAPATPTPCWGAAAPPRPDPKINFKYRPKASYV